MATIYMTNELMMLGRRSKTFERWLAYVICSLCVAAVTGCATTAREWPPEPEWLWQDKNVQKIVLERFSEGLSKQSESIEDRVAIELLVRQFVKTHYVDEGGAEKTSITTEKLSCPLSYECIVDLKIRRKRWDGYSEQFFYLVFIKSSEWSLRHVYRSGAGGLTIN